jgi:formylglycine-generating enzyme required for sulfatase activity
LLLTDILNAFFTNPLRPAYLDRVAETEKDEDADLRSPRSQKRELKQPVGNGRAGVLDFVSFEGGLREAGYGGEGFCFDNELPRHKVWLEPYSLARRLVTCAEFAAFIADDGYRRPELWLSAGWDAVKSNNWNAPLYWTEADGSWKIFTLRGEMPLDRLEASPVSHVSFFEADAYARWAGKRLATEFEWENAAEGQPVTGNLLGTERPIPSAAVWGLLGVDGERLPWLSRFSAFGRFARRVQRQVHERADGAAWRFLRDACGAHPLELPQLLLPGDTLAVLRDSAGFLIIPVATVTKVSA